MLISQSMVSEVKGFRSQGFLSRMGRSMHSWRTLAEPAPIFFGPCLYSCIHRVIWVSLLYSFTSSFQGNGHHFRHYHHRWFQRGRWGSSKSWFSGLPYAPTITSHKKWVELGHSLARSPKWVFRGNGGPYVQTFSTPELIPAAECPLQNKPI